MAAGVPALGIVQTCVEGLQKRDAALAIGTNGVPESFPNAHVDAAQVANDEGSCEQDNKNHQHDEVQDGEADDASLAKLRLLQRVDRGADLTTVRVISKRPVHTD